MHKEDLMTDLDNPPRQFAAIAWALSSGMDHLEGPFPELNLPKPFRWITAKTANFAIEAESTGAYLVKFSYRSPVEHQNGEFYCNENFISQIVLNSGPESAGCASIKCVFQKGMNLLKAKFAFQKKEMIDGGRNLFLLIEDIDVTPIGSSENDHSDIQRLEQHAPEHRNREWTVQDGFRTAEGPAPLPAAPAQGPDGASADQAGVPSPAVSNEAPGSGLLWSSEPGSPEAPGGDAHTSAPQHAVPMPGEGSLPAGAARHRDLEALYRRGLENPVGEFFELITEGIYTLGLRPGDSAVDAGASVGRHTIPMAAAVGPGGSLVAFEPIPELAQRLQEECEARGLSQVRIVPMALAHEQRQARFSWVQAATGLSGLRKRDLPPTEEESVLDIEVPVTTLDAALAGRLQPIRFIKVDIEGGEFDMLRGATRVITDDKPLIVFENGRQMAASLFGYDMDAFFGFFHGIGYRLTDILGRPFTEAQWDAPDMPWYTIASPEQSWFTPSDLDAAIDWALGRLDSP